MIAVRTILAAASCLSASTALSILPASFADTAMNETRGSDMTRGKDVIAKLLQKPYVSLIQVGANDGKIGASNDPLTGALGKPNVHGLLLEPNPAVFEMLKQNIKTQWGEPARLVTAKEAVCPDKSSSTSFYIVSDQFAKDYPKAPHWLKNQLSSMSKQQVTKHWKVAEAAHIFHSEAEFAKYVRQIKVDCLTPLDLMRRHKVAPNKVDILEVDAEGYDGAIVKAFLATSGFRPQIVIFEEKHLQKDMLTSVLELLKTKGYVTQGRGNVLAYLPDAAK